MEVVERANHKCAPCNLESANKRIIQETHIVSYSHQRMQTDTVVYFAYGSLVNRYSRPEHTHAVPARVTGWVREWRHCLKTPRGKVCALTAARRPGAEVEGVMVFDRWENLAEVDGREVGYRREQTLVQRVAGAAPPVATDAFIYVSTGPYTQWGSTEYPIWRSYLDCVIAGYIDVWGSPGAARFIASTVGWEAPLLDDRDAPKYQRAVTLTATMRNLIDQLLEEGGVLRHSR
jgi:cation transport protein ChaC